MATAGDFRRRRIITERSREEMFVMTWEFIVALILAIPIIAFPLFLWYFDIGARYTVIRESMKKRTARSEEKPKDVTG